MEYTITVSFRNKLLRRDLYGANANASGWASIVYHSCAN